MTENDDVRSVPIEWTESEALITRYANNLLVQHAEHEFYLSFFEVRPPLLVGSKEERKAQLANIQSVRAECIARIVVPVERMQSFLEALQENYQRYVASQNIESGEE